MNAHAAYSAKMLLLAALVAVGCKLAMFNTVGCDAFDRDPDDYMAYCNTPSHGHYDHAAFYYDLEPGVHNAVVAANMLVLGSSHIEVALSTNTFVQFERDHRAVHPYLMAFGYSEQNKFAAAVIGKLHPAPKIVVINADPFFVDSASAEAERLMSSPGVERANALAKRVWHELSLAECVEGKRTLITRFVCGTTGTWYRSRADGRWIIRAARARIDSMPMIGVAPFEARPSVYASNAERFLTLLPVEHRCVVITHVPDGTSDSTARAIAAKLGVPFIGRRLEGLGTSDGSHLDEPSSERWSAAFLSALEPVLESCI